MIKYYNNLNLSINEIGKGTHTLCLYSLSGCNMNCYQCLNKDILTKANRNNDCLTMKQITPYIKLNTELIDYIVLSGGEYLINSIEDIKKDIELIRQSTDKPIILYTNGLEFYKLHEIIDLIDGVHMDYKFPFLFYSKKYFECESKYNNTDNFEFHNLVDELYELDIILYLITNKTSLKENNLNIINSLKMIVAKDKGLNQIRTVHYPLFEDSIYLKAKLFENYGKIFFNLCEEDVAEINKEFNKNVPYKINPFVPKENI